MDELSNVLLFWSRLKRINERTFYFNLLKHHTTPNKACVCRTQSRTVHVLFATHESINWVRALIILFTICKRLDLDPHHHVNTVPFLHWRKYEPLYYTLLLINHHFQTICTNNHQCMKNYNKHCLFYIIFECISRGVYYTIYHCIISNEMFILLLQFAPETRKRVLYKYFWYSNCETFDRKGWALFRDKSLILIVPKLIDKVVELGVILIMLELRTTTGCVCGLIL